MGQFIKEEWKSYPKDIYWKVIATLIPVPTTELGAWHIYITPYPQYNPTLYMYFCHHTDEESNVQKGYFHKKHIKYNN